MKNKFYLTLAVWCMLFNTYAICSEAIKPISNQQDTKQLEEAQAKQLTEAQLREAQLREAQLREAQLREAQLREARERQLREAQEKELKEARIKRARLSPFCLISIFTAGFLLNLLTFRYTTQLIQQCKEYVNNTCSKEQGL